LVAEEGSTGIWKGFGPTLVGYAGQGMFKFGLYEVFKDAYSNLAGKEAADAYKPIIWLAGSASAEVFADIALCPFEMIKVRIQTSPTGTFPTAFGAALKEMKAKPEYRYPFGSIGPLWSRQIPYTMAKFFFFEKVVSLFYTHVFTQPKDSYNKVTQLGVTFASGYIAGVVCAVVSHPADSLVSLMGKAEHKGKGAGAIASEVGLKTLATKGLGTRVLMIGTLTGEFKVIMYWNKVLIYPVQDSNGGSTTASRLRWAWVALVASKMLSTLVDTLDGQCISLSLALSLKSGCKAGRTFVQQVSTDHS